MPTRFIVQTATALHGTNNRGNFRRVAVLEVKHPLERVSAIRPEARGLVRIVQVWERCFVGVTEQCAYRRALTKARALADKLNEGE